MVCHFLFRVKDPKYFNALLELRGSEGLESGRRGCVVTEQLVRNVPQTVSYFPRQGDYVLRRAISHQLAACNLVCVGTHVLVSHDNMIIAGEFTSE